MRARTRPTAAEGRSVLVRGPGLVDVSSEIPELSDMLPDAITLTDGQATVSAVLAALDGAGLAHIAAHGTFRADSPLFSALSLVDGPLTVYDLEGVTRAPEHLVLPACDSGRLAAVGADELIGLVASLIPLGTSSVIAALLPVDDAASARLMVELHRHLLAGDRPAAALSAARRHDDSPAAIGAGLSFVCVGRG
jgi:CHAT domain-containing protein